MGLAQFAGLAALVDEHLKLPGGYDPAHAGLKGSALVAGMLAGADYIDDMGLLRHGGMGKLFTGKTVGSAGDQRGTCVDGVTHGISSSVTSPS